VNVLDLYQSVFDIDENLHLCCRTLAVYCPGLMVYVMFVECVCFKNIGLFAKNPAAQCYMCALLLLSLAILPVECCAISFAEWHAHSSRGVLSETA
jgi:hypothetical protein